MPSPRPRPIIVTQQPPRFRTAALLVLAWVVSLAAVWLVASRFAPPSGSLAATQASGEAQAQELARQRDENAALNQEIATLSRSRQVERAAAAAVQATLAERDEEIAAMRSDVAFYERLVGSSAQRQSLTVHSLKLVPNGERAWQYAITLTQTLKKATITKGSLTLQIEGVREGKAQTLAWKDIDGGNGASAPFSFKYFQQIEGSLALPEGFTPHRVKINLDSDTGKVEKTFPWQEGETNNSGVS